MKEKTPTFSILTVVLNRVSSIERAIKSVINQNFKDYEYIIIDGGSIDGTINIIKKYDPFISKWFTDKDTGLYNAMNKGLKLLSGKYVILLNSDDWLEPDILFKLENLIKLNNYSSEIICGGINYYLKSGRSKMLTTNLRRFNRLIDSCQNPVRHPGTLVPLDVYKRIGYFDEKYRICADEDFILRAYYNKEKFIFCDFAISNMEEGGVSTERLNLDKIYREHIEIVKTYSSNRFRFRYLKFRFYAKVCLKRLIHPSLMLFYRR